MNNLIMAWPFFVPLLLIPISLGMVWFLRTRVGLSAEREQAEVFFLNSERVTEAVRTALTESQRGYKYIDVVENDRNTTI